MNARKALHILLILFFLGTFYTINVLSSAAPAPDLVEVLRQETDGKVRISYHSETGKVRFIGTDQAHPMAQPAALAEGATPESAARNFLAAYGSLFGLTDPAQELSVMRTRTLDAGRSMVRFQQSYQGLPVLGGELIVNMDAAHNVLSANGEVLPDIKVDTVPAVEAEAARQIALEKVAKDNNVDVDDLVATQPELWIYNPVLLGGTGPKITSLVWRMDVEANELLPIRELVLVDAHLGFAVLHFNQIDTSRNRTIFDNNNVRSDDLSLNAAVCTEAGGCSGAGTTDDDFAYDFAGDTYDFYFTNHARDSLNGLGMELISTVRYCPLLGFGSCPYDNAFWNGEQMVYGQGSAAADDIVGHEMTHGVTDHESRLFYYRQSGAINESFSDIWGEFIDQGNGYSGGGGETPWLIGEDWTGFGPARSMSDPTIYGDPDSMTSGNYYCGSGDNGGVHFNSGVGNKAAYLMAAGGTFNTITVTSLGVTKTAKIFYEVQTNLFTSASDYQDLYDGLQQACNNLVATGVTTPADCQEVKDAVDATRMNQQPGACAASEAPVCPTGQTVNTLFFDNLENTSSGNWASAPVTLSANEWYYPQNSHSYPGFDATYATSGNTNFWGYNRSGTGDFAMSKTANVSLPAGTSYLHFKHAYAFENGGYDGGVLEYSQNGGAWLDAGGLTAVNGYDGPISTLYDNPLKGRQAFINESNGYISTRLTLSSLAGSNVRFRFRIGTDASVDNLGWFIDDIRIYTCSAAVATNWVYLPQTLRGLTPQMPPAAPTGLSAVALSSSAIRLTWTDNANNEDGYNVERSPNGTTWSPLITLPAGAHSHDDTGLPASTPFHYRVKAYNGTGSSAWSNTATATTLPLSLPTTFNSVADATILQGYAGSNFGNTTDMMAGYDDYYDPDGLIVRSLVKFDVSAIPQGTSINSATLSVYYFGHWDFSGYSRNITAYHPASTWTELGVTWNNAPAPSSSYGSVAVVADGVWRYVSIDVTNLVRGWINGSISNYGIMLRGPEVSGADSSWRSFATREAGASYIPKLVISYPAGMAAPESPEADENLSRGQTVLQVLTGQAYNPLDPRSCHSISNPQAPMKCVSIR